MLSPVIAPRLSRPLRCPAASQPTRAARNPARRYTYFMALYKASYMTTFFGYFLALLDFVGLGVIIQVGMPFLHAVVVLHLGNAVS
jgi:hypothetical protein